MKKSKIIILICLLAAIATTILFMTNSKKDNDVIIESDEEVVIDSSSTDVDEKENSNAEQIKYWIEEYDFPKEQNEFNLNLFNLSLSTPIVLTDLEDKCDYFSYHGGTFKDREEHHVEKISEISTRIDGGREIDVYLEMNDGSYAKLHKFTIKNLSDEQKSAEECIQKGWWDIFDDHSNRSSFDEEALGMEYSKPDDRKREMLLLEDVIEKLGRPTKVVPTFGTPEDKTGDFGIISYEIVYEYSDFVFVLGITESLYLDSNEMHDFRITSIQYLNPECWTDFWVYEIEGDLLK